MEIDAAFLQAALQALKEEIFSTLHVAMPGIVMAYDAAARTANVLPALVRKDSEGNEVAAPLLKAVPVFLCGRETDPVAGDRCLLIFLDFCVDGFVQNGEACVPDSPRMHDLSDAVALVR